MYSETPGHIKTKKLKLRLKLPLYQVAGILEMLWNFAATCADDGGVGRYSNEDIAAHLEYDGDHDELIAALIHCGWLDEHPVDRLVIHDWEHWRPHYITERIRKRGERQKRLDASEKPRTRPQESADLPGRVQESADASGENPPRRQESNKESNKERKSIEVTGLTGEVIEGLKPAVDQLFRRAGYSGKSGLVFWKTAALVKRGQVPFDLVESVAARTLNNASDNAPAFFRKALIDACNSRDINAEELLGSIRFPKNFDRGPPKAVNGGSLGVINELLASRKDSP